MSLSRRDFLQKASGVVAVGVVSSGTPYYFSNNLLAADDKKSEHKIGCIGTGSRWMRVVKPAMKFGNVVAVCDVDKSIVKKRIKSLAGKQKCTKTTVIYLIIQILMS